MAKHLLPVPRLQFFDSDGAMLVGGKLYTYVAGGTTPIVTYTDATGGTNNTNPIILDAYGAADVWGNIQQQYKFVLKDADDNTIFTIDDIEYDNIFGENITWTGNHIFSGTVTLGSVLGNVTFSGDTLVDNNLYVTGTFGVDGNASFNGDIASDSITSPLITLSSGETIESVAGVIEITSDLNILFTTDNDGTPRTFDMREDGTFRLSVETPVNDLDVVTKGYLDDRITAAVAGGGLIPVAIGCVVSNLLVSGSIGVTSVAHPGTGLYTITLSSATTSTAKTIVMTTVRDPSTLRNWCAFPTVNSTTEIALETGGGNSWASTDVDFNFVVYSLP